MNPLARRLATTLMRAPGVTRALRAIAAARGHGLVLVYHRLGAPLQPDCEIVPSVTVELFNAQLRALGEVVDLVSLDLVVAHQELPRTARRGPRPAVAITFDDDLPSHVEHALPVLRQRGVPATFFLSGRALHGLGGYWFQHLETLLLTQGQRRTAALLGVPGLPIADVLFACERDANLRQRLGDLASDLSRPRVLDAGDFERLTTAGMTVGFHTVGHEVLPDLDDTALEQAIERGRADLAAAANAPIRYFAYPHGKADARSAAAVRRAGFSAAFTGRRQPVRHKDDRYRLGRWEPGPLAVEDLLVQLAVRLHDSSDESGRQSRPWM